MWWWFGSILFLIIWIAIAFWPARVAARKGHSFLGFFILSLIFFPLSLILAYVVTAFVVKVPWTEALRSTVIPSIQGSPD